MELIFRLGAKIRNPSLFDRYRFLKETERWPLHKLEAFQLEECRRFLAFAGEHSPYYQDLFRRVGFSPAQMNSLGDLKSLPVIEKESLIQENERIHSRFPFPKVFLCETSGTTGQVLTFRRDERWDSANRAAVMRGYSWYGIKPWDRNVYLWGFNFSPAEKLRVRVLDLLQNRFRVFSYERSQIERLARHTRRAVYLHGYSSMIFNIARILNANPDLPKPRHLLLVKGTSEKIFDSYQEEALKAFGKKIVSEYGAAEAGLIAFECPHGSMHVHIEGCVVEVVDGEILVTNLLSRSYPIIRYRLGDAVTLAPAGYRCPCGMAHPVIETVIGRVGKVVYGKKDAYPSLSFYYLFKNLYFERGLALCYRAIQSEKGRVSIEIEESAGDSEEMIRQEISKLFGDDLDVSLSFGVELGPVGGKRQDFVSYLDDA